MGDANKNQENESTSSTSSSAKIETDTETGAAAAAAASVPSLDNVARNLRERMAGLRMTTRGESERETSANLGRDVSLLDFLDVWMFCYSPVNQLGTYYREGSIDPCVEPMKDMWTCLKLRMDYTSEEKNEMMSRLDGKRGGGNKANPSSAVWSFRTQPQNTWAPVIARATASAGAASSSLS